MTSKNVYETDMNFPLHAYVNMIVHELCMHVHFAL